MDRKRSAALRDTAGVYHVASRLASEGFHATVARGSGFGADVLATLPGSTDTAALMVRTTVCPPGFAGGAEGKADVCEWRMGKGVGLTEDPGPFVALVDLKRARELPRVWVLPPPRCVGTSPPRTSPGRVATGLRRRSWHPTRTAGTPSRAICWAAVFPGQDGSIGRSSRNATERSSSRRWPRRPLACLGRRTRRSAGWPTSASLRRAWPRRRLC